MMRKFTSPRPKNRIIPANNDKIVTILTDKKRDFSGKTDNEILRIALQDLAENKAIVRESETKISRILNRKI